MNSNIAQSSALKLSICIATLNRAAFIGATLDSILGQLTNDCEVVVLDGGSNDETERVISEYADRFDRLRYIRQKTNNGIDRDYDRAVDLATGEYCWLMSDDDLIKPGAVATVLRALRPDLSLVVVNTEFRDHTMSRVLQSRWIDVKSDCVYRPEEMNRLFMEVGHMLKYIGCLVIKRAIWLARERQQYYGSLFAYLGAIFQEPLPGDALLVAEPFVSYRMGNTHTYSPKVFEVVMIKWPSIVWSLNVSDSAKRKISTPEPWREFERLLLARAIGYYSATEYRRWIRPKVRSVREAFTPTLLTLLPVGLANALCVFYYSATRRPFRGVLQPAMILQALKDSRLQLRAEKSGRAARSIPNQTRSEVSNS